MNNCPPAIELHNRNDTAAHSIKSQNLNDQTSIYVKNTSGGKKHKQSQVKLIK